ncbi:hypothetical protein ARMGADRAFT_870890, partial [Armillaria gallica]
WSSPMYAFYAPVPKVDYRDGCRCHVFGCMSQSNETPCGHRIAHYLDTKDAQSMSNLRKHAQKCWGEDAVEEADEAGNVGAAWSLLKGAGSDKQNGSITAHFACQGKGRVTYSNRQHTKVKAQLFAIVRDCGYKCLMKTSWPSCYIPSPSTVARDVKTIFEHTCQCILDMLQSHDRELHFATDAWTLPNHHPYVVVTVHFEENGKPISLLLDIVEVAKNHTGQNLADEF